MNCETCGGSTCIIVCRTIKPENLRKTGRKANLLRDGLRIVYRDINKQEWVKTGGKWWRFPQEVEY